MDKIELLSKEYDSLRQESLDSMNNRTQIVSFGLATIGVLIAAIFTSEQALKSINLVITFFSFGIPIVCILILYIWLGEVERMMRVGNYLRGLEARINELIDANKPTLCWEEWLRSEKTQMRYPYLVVIALFLGIAVASPIIGLITIKLSIVSYKWAILIPWILEIFIIIHIGLRTNKFK